MDSNLISELVSTHLKFQACRTQQIRLNLPLVTQGRKILNCYFLHMGKLLCWHNSFSNISERKRACWQNLTCKFLFCWTQKDFDNAEAFSYEHSSVQRLRIHNNAFQAGSHKLSPAVTALSHIAEGFKCQIWQKKSWAKDKNMILLLLIGSSIEESREQDCSNKQKHCTKDKNESITSNDAIRFATDEIGSTPIEY